MAFSVDHKGSEQGHAAGDIGVLRSKQLLTELQRFAKEWFSLCVLVIFHQPHCKVVHTSCNKWVLIADGTPVHVEGFLRHCDRGIEISLLIGQEYEVVERH